MPSRCPSHTHTVYEQFTNIHLLHYALNHHMVTLKIINNNNVLTSGDLTFITGLLQKKVNNKNKLKQCIT